MNKIEELEALFYSRKYDDFLEKLSSIDINIYSVKINRLLVEYLHQRKHISKDFSDLVLKIESENKDSFLNIPSYPVLLYNLSLLQFRLNNIENCKIYINKIVDNANNFNRRVLLYTSILILEIFIRTGQRERIEFAVDYLKRAPDIEVRFIGSIHSLLLRYNVFNIIHSSTMKEDNKKSELKKILEVNFISDIKTKIETSRVLTLSYLAFYLGDEEKNRNILNSCDNGFNFAIMNNKGLYEFSKRKYSLSNLYFSNALNSLKNKETVYPRYRTIYSLALSNLLKNRPRRAFTLFMSITSILNKSPFLWLRLAESVIMFYKKRLSKLRKQQQSPIFSSKYVTQSRIVYILPSSNYKLFMSDTKERDKDLNLEFAVKAAQNAILLAGENKPIIQQALKIKSYSFVELNDGERAIEAAKQMNDSDNMLRDIYEDLGAIVRKNQKEQGQRLQSSRYRFNMQAENSLIINLIHAQHKIKMGEDPGHSLDKVKKVDRKKIETVLTDLTYRLRKGDIKEAGNIINNFLKD